MIRMLLLTLIRFGAGRWAILWRYISAAYCMVVTIEVFAVLFCLKSLLRFVILDRFVACDDGTYFLRTFFSLMAPLLFLFSVTCSVIFR